MLFAILCDDRPGARDLRVATRPDHIAYLQSLGPALRFAGPFLEDDETSVGSMLVVEANTADAARAIAEADPYAKAGLFATVSVRRWKWAVNNPDA